MNTVNNTELKYDRHKDRQGLFDEVFAKKLYVDNIQFITEWISEIEIEKKRLDAGEYVDGLPDTLPPEMLPRDIYIVAMIEYTLGFPIEAVRQRFEQAIEYSQLCLDINAQFPPSNAKDSDYDDSDDDDSDDDDSDDDDSDYDDSDDDDWTMSVWGSGISLGEDLPNAIGLCILFDRPDWLNIIRECYLIADWDGPAFSALINMVIPTEFDPKERFPRGGFNFRKPLLQAVMAKTKKETFKYLNAYLAGWYEGYRKIGNCIIDSHLRQNPEFGGYYGYWAFDAAAVAYLKDIDDSQLHQYLYYPKDMVEWAREQRRLRYAAQDSESLQPLLRTAGQTAPLTGKYGVDNFSGFESYFKAGETLPAGQVSGKRDEQGNPILRQDTVWRLLSREDGGATRFSPSELQKYSNN